MRSLNNNIKLRGVLKIILLACCIIITGIMIVAIYSLVIVKSLSLSFGMLINIFVCITGILSITYHFKTLKFYKRKQQNTVIKDTTLWVSNIVFALLLIYLSISLTYAFYNINNEDLFDSGIYIMYIFCFILLLVGLSLIIEEILLYRGIKKDKSKYYHNNIEGIKGHQDDEI